MIDPDLEDLANQAGSFPYGAARVAALEAVVARADVEAPDSDLPFWAREKLIYSYSKAGETAKAFVPFAWCLATYDADPQRYARYTHALLWAFKWQPSWLEGFPEVPLAQTETVLDDMERRYRAGGHSMHAVHQGRLSLARHLGRAEEAAEQWRLWELSPRDDLSDCSGCVPSAQVSYLTEVGRHEEAVRRAEPVLQGHLTCSEQPQRILTNLLDAYVLTGRLDAAADAHRRAYQLMRGDRSELAAIGTHLEFLARTGNAITALPIVETHLSWLDEPDNPWAEMQFAAYASLALSRLDPTLEVRALGKPAAGALAADLADRARAVAARFDVRNGSTVVSERVEGWLTASDWVAELPLTAIAKRRRQVAARPVAEPTPVVTVAAAVGADADELLDHVEARLPEGDEEGASTAITALTALGELTPHQQVRLDDARVRLSAHEDLPAAVEAWREILERYDAVGDELRSRRCRARIGRSLSSLGESVEALLVGEEPLRWLIENDDRAGAAGGWAVSLGMMLVNAEREGEAAAVVAAARAADAELEGQTRFQLAHIHGTAAAASGDLDVALAAYVDAVSHAPALGPGAEAEARWRLGGVLRMLDRSEDAVEELTESVALFATLGDDAPATRFDLAIAYLVTDRAAEAAELAEELVRSVDGAEDPGLNHVLADAYETLGEPERALGHLRTLIRVSEPEAAQLAEMRSREGTLLSAIDTVEAHGEAVAAFRESASLWGGLDDLDGQIPALRRAGRAAVAAGRGPEAGEIRAEIAKLAEGLPDDYREFQLAGIAWDEALQIHEEDRAGAIRLLREAEARYRGIESTQLVVDCVLFRHELGDTVSVGDLRAAHESSETGSRGWYRSGYALADLLAEQGDAQAASALHAELDDHTT